MDSRLRRSQRDYSLAFKLSVVDQGERGELTYKKAQERYRIQGRSTVLGWLRRHGRQDWSGGASSAPMTTSPKSGPTKPLTPEQQIKALQVQGGRMRRRSFSEPSWMSSKEDYREAHRKKAFRQVLTQRRPQGPSVARACRHFCVSRQGGVSRLSSPARQLVEGARAIALVGGYRGGGASLCSNRRGSAVGKPAQTLRIWRPTGY